MNRWARFFLGTPRRFAISFVIVAILAMVVHFQPGLVFSTLDRVVCECMPLIKSVLMIVIVFAGFRLIVGGRR